MPRTPEVIRGAPFSFLLNPAEDAKFEITLKPTSLFFWKWEAHFWGYGSDEHESGVTVLKEKARLAGESAVNYLRHYVLD